MAESDHPLVRAMYEDGGGARRDPREVTFMDLPVEVRSLLARTSRLIKLTSMNAPHAILDQERRLVAESALALNGYVTTQALEPAARLSQAQHDEAARKRLQAHLAARHGTEVADEATCNVLIELHNNLHDHPAGEAPDHEDFDYDPGETT